MIGLFKKISPPVTPRGRADTLAGELDDLRQALIRINLETERYLARQQECRVALLARAGEIESEMVNDVNEINKANGASAVSGKV
jgi:hypothetical protein